MLGCIFSKIFTKYRTTNRRRTLDMKLWQAILIPCGTVIFIFLWFAFADWADRHLPDWTPLVFIGLFILAGIVLAVLGI